MNERDRYLDPRPTPVPRELTRLDRFLIRTILFPFMLAVLVVLPVWMRTRRAWLQRRYERRFRKLRSRIQRVHPDLLIDESGRVSELFEPRWHAAYCKKPYRKISILERTVIRQCEPLLDVMYRNSELGVFSGMLGTRYCAGLTPFEIERDGGFFGIVVGGHKRFMTRLAQGVTAREILTELGQAGAFERTALRVCRHVATYGMELQVRTRAVNAEFDGAEPLARWLVLSNPCYLGLRGPSFTGSLVAHTASEEEARFEARRFAEAHGMSTCVAEIVSWENV